jgi:GT2 family glycosyltransferase
VSTYNRPDALISALAGVSSQTYDRWRALVIGDDCSDETGRRLSALGDPKIAYINLAQRFGEQSGPNSIGMALADTKYIAFLNHDDLWLPHHLQHGIDRLESESADLFTGRSAVATVDPDNLKRMIFRGTSPTNRRLRDAFFTRPNLFEPVSAWIMTAKAARRVGLWQPAARLYRTPLVDWILRAWREGLVHVDSPLFTVLRSAYLKPNGSTLRYDEQFRDFTEWLDKLQRTEVERLQLKVEQDIAEAGARGLALDFTRLHGPKASSWVVRYLLAPPAAEIFRQTGWDAMNLYYRANRENRGSKLRALLLVRTGEELHAPPDFNSVLSDAEIQLSYRSVDQP